MGFGRVTHGCRCAGQVDVIGLCGSARQRETKPAPWPNPIPIPTAAASPTPAPRRRSPLRRAVVGVLPIQIINAKDERLCLARPRSPRFPSAPAWQGRGCRPWPSSAARWPRRTSSSSGRGAGFRWTPSLPHVPRYQLHLFSSLYPRSCSRHTCFLLMSWHGLSWGFLFVPLLNGSRGEKVEVVGRWVAPRSPWI
jgi:hypothetical protein